MLGTRPFLVCRARAGRATSPGGWGAGRLPLAPLACAAGWRGVTGARGEAPCTQIASEWPPHLLSPPEDAGQRGLRTCGGTGTGLGELTWSWLPAGATPPQGPTRPIVKVARPSWRVPQWRTAGGANSLPRGPALYGTRSRLSHVPTEQGRSRTQTANLRTLAFQKEPTFQSRPPEKMLPHKRGADAGRAVTVDGPLLVAVVAHGAWGLWPWTPPPGLGAW